MKTKVAYLVVGHPYRGRPVIRRAMQSQPRLEPGEAFVRIELDLPDDFFSKPVHTVEVTGDGSVVAVEAGLEGPDVGPS